MCIALFVIAYLLGKHLSRKTRRLEKCLSKYTQLLKSEASIMERIATL